MPVSIRNGYRRVIAVMPARQRTADGMLLLADGVELTGQALTGVQIVAADQAQEMTDAAVRISTRLAAETTLPSDVRNWNDDTPATVSETRWLREARCDPDNPAVLRAYRAGHDDGTADLAPFAAATSRIDSLYRRVLLALARREFNTVHRLLPAGDPLHKVVRAIAHGTRIAAPGPSTGSRS